MGITPISSLPYVVSLGVPLTVGMLTILLHAGLLGIEYLLMRREIQLLQLGTAVVFGVFIDLILAGLSWLVPVSYPEQILLERSMTFRDTKAVLDRGDIVLRVI